jgi:DNA-directed RNA polymerase subunit K
LDIQEWDMGDLTRFERARIVGARALQISMGAPILVEVDGLVDPVDIAELELKEGVIPITVRRR